MPVREINPVVNGVTGDETNFYPASNAVAFVAAGKRFRCRTQPDEMVEQPVVHPGRKRLENCDRFQIHEKTVIHGEKLFWVAFQQLVEFYPVSRVVVVDLPCQFSLEVFVRSGLLREQKGN